MSRQAELVGREKKKIPDDWNIQYSLLINQEPRWEIKIRRGGTEMCAER